MLLILWREGGLGFIGKRVVLCIYLLFFLLPLLCSDSSTISLWDTECREGIDFELLFLFPCSQSTSGYHDKNSNRLMGVFIIISFSSHLSALVNGSREGRFHFPLPCFGIVCWRDSGWRETNGIIYRRLWLVHELSRKNGKHGGCLTCASYT